MRTSSFGVWSVGTALALLGCTAEISALPGNSHVRYEGENLSQVLLSIAGLMGTSLASLGANEGLLNSGLSGLDA